MATDMNRRKKCRETYRIVRLGHPDLATMLADGWALSPFRGQDTVRAEGNVYVWLVRPAERFAWEFAVVRRWRIVSKKERVTCTG